MLRTTALLASLAATAATATEILLPLYIYPSAVYEDDAANWQPAFSAISSQPSVDWLVVVNVDSGPGGSTSPGDGDVNYIYGTSHLNSYSNVKTVGYVHTLYGAADMSALQANISTWAGWASYTESDIAVQGIFFDESGTNSYDYLSEAISYAKSQFPSDFISVCNFGTTAAAEYYGICDVVIAFEDKLSKYNGQSTVNSNIPSGYADQAAIIVNEFTGSASALASDIATLKSDGVGYAYFCSGGYDSITTAPADVSQLATDFA
ncbi:Spherulation-specific family 4-domain-containing protein [Xylariaceae sp. FL0255]|nr:Spherulation-specific family 4-domain-containing protein [Xylariaceae sp. FL0255]